MSMFQQEYHKSTGKATTDLDGSISKEYVEWLENHLITISTEFCRQAEKMAFHDKCGEVYYTCKKIITSKN